MGIPGNGIVYCTYNIHKNVPDVYFFQHWMALISLNCLTLRTPAREKFVRKTLLSYFSQLTAENSLSTVGVPGNAVSSPPRNSRRVKSRSWANFQLSSTELPRSHVSRTILKELSRLWVNCSSWNSRSMTSTSAADQRYNKQSAWKGTMTANSRPRSATSWCVSTGSIPKPASFKELRSPTIEATPAISLTVQTAISFASPSSHPRQSLQSCQGQTC